MFCSSLPVFDLEEPAQALMLADLSVFDLDEPLQPLMLADVKQHYDRKSRESVVFTHALFLSSRGQVAAGTVVEHRAGETRAAFAVRVMNTANPTSIYQAFVCAGCPETSARIAYHCCWLSVVSQYSKRCIEHVPGYSIDRVGKNGMTLLSTSISADAENAVYWLMRRGASPHARNANGTTALSHCVGRCIASCAFAIEECVHERMKILMLCDAAPSNGGGGCGGVGGDAPRAPKRKRTVRK
jgi:hypothetical protein